MNRIFNYRNLFIFSLVTAAALMLLIGSGSKKANTDTAEPAKYETTLLFKSDEATQVDTLVNFSDIDTTPEKIEEIVNDFMNDEAVLDTEEQTEEIEALEESEALAEKVPVITHDYEDVDEPIPFETIYKKDTSMKKGETRIENGENGIKTKVYYIEFTDGVETSRRLETEKIKKQPVPKIVYEGTIDTQTAVRGTKFAYKKVLQCRATAYTNDAKWGDHIAFSYLCGGGLRTRWGIIATDPDYIAPGTLVYIKSLREGVKDYGYAIAADVGGSIKGDLIDLWMDSESLCNSWGIKPVEVYVLEDQSADIFALRGDYEWER